MQRRSFLSGTAAAAAAALAGCQTAGSYPRDTVMSVLGAIAPHELGRTLPHEHIMADFAGAEKASPARYDPDNIYWAALPHLVALRRAGATGFADCTPAYLGRDVQVLARLSRATELHILTNTGYYGASGGKYLPAHAYEDSTDDLAERWLDEWQGGIEGTRIRPGFIKIGVNDAPLSDTDRKLVCAAARVHRKAGLTIASHTTSGAAALEQIALLAEEGVSPDAFIWVHANAEGDAELHIEAAGQGAWVEFDGISESTIDPHVALVANMAQAGLLGKVLLSHDSGWYSVGEPGGGAFRGYTTLFTHFLPALEKAGYGRAEGDQLVRVNPARAFTIRRRLLSGS